MENGTAIKIHDENEIEHPRNGSAKITNTGKKESRRFSRR